MYWLNILYTIITLVVGITIIRFASKYVNKLRSTKTFKTLIKKNPYNAALLWYTSYFIKMAMYIIVSLIAISFLGFAQEIMLFVAVVMTLSIIGVLAYSLRDLIPSAFAGAYLMYSKIIRKGDKISIEGFKGKVREVSLLAITIVDDKKGIVIIPNKIIAEKILKKEK